MTLLNFAPLRPDRIGVNAVYALDATNVLPSPDGYIPFPKHAPFTQATTDPANDGITAIAADGSVHVFAGTEEDLIKLDTTDNSWDVVTQTATTYGSNDLAKWWFIQFGDYIVAGNINDAPQSFQLGVSTEFSDLAGNPPNADGAAVWGDHLALFAGDTVYWSDTSDIGEWATGNSGSQQFPDGGPVMGSNNVTNPFIIQRDAIRRGTFSPGSLEVFSFQKTHDKVGAASRKSVCSRGDLTFFASFGAFYQLNPDGSLIPIGDEKLDRWFFSQLSGSALANIIGRVDPFYPRVYFSAQVASSGVYDLMLVYDWSKQEWSKISVGAGVLFPLASATIGYSLEQIGAIYGALENVPYSLDSNVWKGGAPTMGAMDATGRFGFFSGENARASIATAGAGATTGQMTFMDGVFPVTDTDQLTVSVGTRNRLQDDFTWGPELTPNPVTGQIDFIAEARFFAFRQNIAEGADWTKAQGIDVPGRASGWR